MVTWFGAVWTLVILQRLGELALARKNAARLAAMGGYEVGAGHYPWLAALHGGFLLSLWLEVRLAGWGDQPPVPLFLSLFLLAQGVRVWVILTLGPFWNTRIFVVPGAEPVTRGPYRWLKHPNYLVVATELFTLPMAFGAACTALVFSLLNLVLLRVRIQVEEQALREATPYEERMAGRW